MCMIILTNLFKLMILEIVISYLQIPTLPAVSYMPTALQTLRPHLPLINGWRNMAFSLSNALSTILNFLSQCRIFCLNFFQLHSHESFLLLIVRHQKAAKILLRNPTGSPNKNKWQRQTIGIFCNLQAVICKIETQAHIKALVLFCRASFNCEYTV